MTFQESLVKEVYRWLTANYRYEYREYTGDKKIIDSRDEAIFKAGANYGFQMAVDLLRGHDDTRPFIMGMKPLAHPIDLAKWLEAQKDKP